MRFRSSHGFEMRKHDKRVAKKAIDITRRKISSSLQILEQRIDKHAIDTASLGLTFVALSSTGS